jgi:hypothetical protein
MALDAQYPEPIINPLFLQPSLITCTLSSLTTRLVLPFIHGGSPETPSLAALDFEIIAKSNFRVLQNLNIIRIYVKAIHHGYTLRVIARGLRITIQR